MTHDDLQSLLGAYAVDAVDAGEAQAVEAHLADCPRCRAEVAELREVAALLSHSGADAPEGVWTRIASALEETPPPLRLEAFRQRGGADGRRDRSRTRRVVRSGALAVAAAVVVVLAVSVVNLRSQVDDLRSQRAAGTGSSVDVALAAERALTGPGARIARLVGARGESAVAVVQPNGQGYFLGGSLPVLDARIYELWGATSSGQIAALGTVPGPGTYAFTADPSVKTVMVTVEEAPVSSPTSSAVVTGNLV